MVFDRKTLRDFDTARRANPNWPVFLSDGDSWFSFSNIIGELDGSTGRRLHAASRQRKWALYRQERNGDEIMTILSGGQRARLRRLFERCPLDGMLFSAGGNDIIGPDLLPLLQPYRQGATARDLLVVKRLQRRLRQIEDCYRELCDLLGDADQRVKLFINSYDYLIPSNKPYRLIGRFRLAGPWLIQHFKTRNIPKPLRSEIVACLIDDFCDMLDRLATESPGQQTLIRVETRNSVGTHWRDEIHPNREGARIVSGLFEQAIQAEGFVF
jgi:lysophospholipase L1-like esterase